MHFNIRWFSWFSRMLLVTILPMFARAKPTFPTDRGNVIQHLYSSSVWIHSLTRDFYKCDGNFGLAKILPWCSFNMRHMPEGCGWASSPDHILCLQLIDSRYSTWPAVWETNESNWPNGVCIHPINTNAGSLNMYRAKSISWKVSITNLQMPWLCTLTPGAQCPPAAELWPGM